MSPSSYVIGQQMRRLGLSSSARAMLGVSLGTSAMLGLAACAGNPPAPASSAPVAAAPAAMPADPMVGGSAMSPSKTIVANAVNSNDHTTLVAAVKAAGLVDTLEGPGPFTVFAPTNEAFAALPHGTVQHLLKPSHKAQLVRVLTYHVVPGRLDSAALDQQIMAGGGTATLTTVEGGTLSVMKGPSGQFVLTDAKGRHATVTIADVYQSNGVIDVVDAVLLPPRK